MSTKKLIFGPIFFSTLFSVLLIALTPLLRQLQGNPFSSAMETYIHLNQLSMPEHFFDFFLQQAVLFTSSQFVVIVLPLLFALGSLMLVVALAKPYFEQTIHMCAFIILLGLTPAFIAVHVGITLYAALLFFTLLVVYLFKKNYYAYLFFLILLFYLNTLYAFFVFLSLFILEFFKKENKHALIVFVLFILLLFTSSFLSLPLSFQSAFSFDSSALFDFLGGRYGYSLFLLFLGTGGFFIYHHAQKAPLQKIFHASILLLSFFYEPARLIGVILLTYYALQGFTFLVSEKWHNTSLQQLTALLFVCILLFSTISYMKEEVTRLPTQEHIQTLSYLRATISQHTSHAHAKILTNPQNEPFVTFFSGLEVYTASSQELLSSQRASFVTSTLQQEHIAFIFIDPFMLQGDVWQRPDEGLLFVMNYDNHFKKLYDQSGYRIYYYLDWNATFSPELS